MKKIFKTLALIGAVSFAVCDLLNVSRLSSNNSYLKQNVLRLEKKIDALPNKSDSISSLLSNKKISSIRPLYNLDDSPDFIRVTFEEGGYAIYYSETMELLECSLSSTRVENDLSYYGGPGCYLSKKDNSFVDNLTKAKFTLNKDSIVENSNSIRDHFSKKSMISNKEFDSKSLHESLNYNVSNIQKDSGESSPPTYDETGPVTIPNANYIPNYRYFLSDPIFGINDSDKCGAVATQMLLSYHNFFSDRRLIPNNYLFGDANNNRERNPNYCSDPMLMTRYTLGTTSNSSDANSYYSYIVKKVPGNASIEQVKNGIASVIKDRNNVLTNKMTYSLHYYLGGWFPKFQPIGSSGPIGELDKGRPIILLMHSSVGGSINHYVVGYGHGNYTYPETGKSYKGYVVNFGWSSQYENVWINSSWCRGYVSLKFSHVHDYSNIGPIGSTDRVEYKCVECNHRTDSSISINERTRYLEKEIKINPTDSTYKDIYLRTQSTAVQLFQTFGLHDVELVLYDDDYKNLNNDDNSGYLQNAFFWHELKANKAYILRIVFYNIHQESTAKIGITPGDAYYKDFNDIGDTSINTGMTLSWTSLIDSTKPIIFTPLTTGPYRLTTSSLDGIDTYLYLIDPTNATTTIYDDDSGGSRQALLQVNLRAGITYLAIVSAYNIVNNAGRMSFRVEKVS